MNIKILGAMAFGIGLAGCAIAPTTQKLSTVEIGMSKDQVVAIMGHPLYMYGNPKDPQTDDTTEYYGYLTDTSALDHGTQHRANHLDGSKYKANYFVRFEHDKVDAFGDNQHFGPPGPPVQDFYGNSSASVEQSPH